VLQYDDFLFVCGAVKPLQMLVIKGYKSPVNHVTNPYEQLIGLEST
jgi:hypothetical protein